MTSIDFVDFTLGESCRSRQAYVLADPSFDYWICSGLNALYALEPPRCSASGFCDHRRAKGLSNRVVIYKHAVRNAINPLITIFGYQLILLSGAALTEIVMNWPGIGSLMLNAVQGKDYYLVMGNLIIGSVMLILGNLVSDILLAVSDPGSGTNRRIEVMARTMTEPEKNGGDIVSR